MIVQGAEAMVYYKDGATSVVKERASIYSTTQKAVLIVLWSLLIERGLLRTSFSASPVERLFITSSFSLMDFSWTSHGLLMDFSWTSHGLLMDLSWTSHGLLMDFSWTSHGPLIANPFHKGSVQWLHIVTHKVRGISRKEVPLSLYNIFRQP